MVMALTKIIRNLNEMSLKLAEKCYPGIGKLWPLLCTAIKRAFGSNMFYCKMTFCVLYLTH